MNLTKQLRAHICQEFASGKKIAELDRVFMLKPGTTEQVLRVAMKHHKQDQPSLFENIDNGDNRVRQDIQPNSTVVDPG